MQSEICYRPRGHIAFLFLQLSCYCSVNSFSLSALVDSSGSQYRQKVLQRIKTKKDDVEELSQKHQMAFSSMTLFDLNAAVQCMHAINCIAFQISQYAFSEQRLFIGLICIKYISS